MATVDEIQVQKFKNTLDSLKGCDATIAALIDMSEGYPFPEYYWIWGAMKSRGLAELHFGEHDPITGYPIEPSRGFCLTDYGKAFVEWMKKPRDLPQTMSMFDEQEQP